ncbi:hypothetical protein [Sivoneniella epilithica]
MTNAVQVIDMGDRECESTPFRFVKKLAATNFNNYLSTIARLY